MKKHIALIHFLIMLLAASAFMYGVQLTRRPSVKSISAMLCALPEYSGMQKYTGTLSGAYAALTAPPVADFCVYIAQDGTSREFAVCRISSGEPTEPIIEAFKARVAELEAAFSGKADELKRIEYFRIVNTDNFITLTVCDANSTADNAVHRYFALH